MDALRSQSGAGGNIAGQSRTVNYPGLGLPLRHYPQTLGQFYPMGTHIDCNGSNSEFLPVREVAMMVIMETLTDKKDWHNKIFNDEIVVKWKQEALAYPDKLLWRQATGGKTTGQSAQEKEEDEEDEEAGEDELEDEEDIYSTFTPYRLKGIMSNEAFDYCVKELRDKAKYYEATGIVPTLDSSSSVAKSDTIVSGELQNSLRRAFDKLKADQGSTPDWHPRSNDMVQDLVHPSMYPLVYGRSTVFKDEVVGVHDAIDKWAGKGEVIEKSGPPMADSRFGPHVNRITSSFWSDTYQWLPANVAFQDDGTVKFTSYINNLHPKRFPDVYNAVEKLIQAALPMWDQCLQISPDYYEKSGAGRLASRFSEPNNPDDENTENWNPSDAAEVADVEIDWDKVDPKYSDAMDWGDPEDDQLDIKWKALREPVQLQPDQYEALNYAPPERLADKFKESGLQVIVKMASIELTPEKPVFPTGGWHVEGQMNEQICATALYYLDSENITPSSLAFRMQTSPDLDDFNQYLGQESYSWMERVYGTHLKGAPCLQNYGSVQTIQGRLLAFPNVFQHRVSSFRLADPTKPGYRRFIALWLVDPHTRIISTANVPPQQRDWWIESMLGPSAESRQAALSQIPAELVQLLRENGLLDGNDGLLDDRRQGRLPLELMNMLRSYFDATLMTNEEAKEHRAKLMEVRTSFHAKADGEWQQQKYNFCEH